MILYFSRKLGALGCCKMMQARWLALCVVCGIAMVHAAPLDYVLPLVGLRQRGSVAFEMDIHLPVSGEALEAVQSANAFLNAHLNSTEIDFSSKHKPHVTLYLTTWSCGSFTSRGGGSPEKVLTCLEKIETAICEIAPQLEALGPCTVGLSNVYAAGEFAMMNVSYSPCLQRFSDVVVNATNQYSLPNQTAPDWVYSLPEPERSEKLRYIALYGSPNVFSQFSPHVSLAWGPDAHSISAAIDALPLTPARLNFVGDVFSLGTVGQHGTVLSHMVSLTTCY